MLEIALVNNMPDGAFAETERQFTRLLEDASDDLELRVGLYSLPGLPRSEDTAGYISSRYYPLERLFGMQADAVIVTGTEPLAEHLTAEPYWEALTGLINWAAESTVSAVLSCLAAHAAVLLFDGIEREPLAEKCSGVFSHEVVTSHTLVEGMAGPIFVPHSRLNDVPYRSLSEHGYTSFLSSHELDWTVLARERGNCLFMFVQGHPEYSTSSLLREYRRDLHRFIRGERDHSPPVPSNYLDEEGERLLREFAAATRTQPGSADVMERFPFDHVRQHVVNTWRAPGKRLYANWIKEILRRKHHRKTGRVSAAGEQPVSEEQGTRSAGA